MYWQKPKVLKCAVGSMKHNGSCMVRLHPEGCICIIQIVVVRFYSVNILLFPQAAHNLAFGVLYGFPHLSQSGPICPSE